MKQVKALTRRESPVVAAVLCLFVGSSACAAEGWRPLFAPDYSDGVHDPAVWHVDADGNLTAEKDVAYWTKDEYSRFELECEYNLDPAGNSGVVIYCSDTENWIPNSVEIQLIDNEAPKWRGLNPRQANLAFFGHQAPSSNPARPAGEWNSFRLKADGPRLEVSLNGVLVNACDLSQWTDAKRLPDGSEIPPWLSRPWSNLATTGRIGFQGRHAGARVRFRNIRIRPLPATRRIRRLMSFNIRMGCGHDDPFRLPNGSLGHLPQCAQVIGRYLPDYCGLQEVDRFSSRAGGMDQTAELAGLCGMEGSWVEKIPQYGISALYRERPFCVSKVLMKGHQHTRALMISEFHDCVIANTHYPLTEETCNAAAETTLSALRGYAKEKPVFLMGDFNSLPDSEAVRILRREFEVLTDPAAFTFPAKGPDRTIDYIFVDKAHAGAFRVLSRKVIAAPEATDHAALLVELAPKGESVSLAISLNGPGWTCDGEAVSIPHTWNEPDGSDGLGLPEEGRIPTSVKVASYCRKKATYVRALPDPVEGRRSFLRFDGVSEKAVVFVNGKEVGAHTGAFGSFVVEITDALKADGNVLEVTADNTYDPSVPPYEGDFTVFGGIYRDVTLVTKPLVCIDPRHPIIARTDPDGGSVEVTFTPYGEKPRTERFEFANPEMWSPESPKLYSATVRVGEDEETVEFGFRKAEFRTDGFYLNGKRRQIRGVCRHQDLAGKGWALSASDEERDVKLLKELGADGVRTSHYPNSSRFYSLCDRYGILVWTEIPVVDEVPRGDDVFRRNALMMAEEMVTQHINHPSIIIWGIFNEVYQCRKPDGSAERVLAEVRDRIHALDPTRPVGGASNGKKVELNAVPDVLGMNLYPGWYGTSVDMMDTFIEEAGGFNRRTSFAVTEYGAGGSIHHHDDPLARPRPKSFWHPEEYQAFYHARAYRYMVENPLVWGTFAWQMFDSAADARQEGERPGINDKGLVTRDRVFRKDAWYLYHANWSKEPVLHLCGSRWRETERDEISVLAFSNVGDAELKVNGVHFDDKEADPAKVLLWEEVPLSVGTNTLTVTAGSMKRELTIVRKEKSR